MTGVSKRQQITALHGIRALAFFAVFLVHVGVPGVPGGGLGVAVFFTLSGFLITSLLLHEQLSSNRVRLGRFYARRAVRLTPPLLLVVAFSVAYALVAFRNSPDLKHETLAGSPAVIFYVGNWVRAFADETGVLGLLAHTWSLSIEEQFYLAWPLLLIAAHRCRGVFGVLIMALAGSGLSLLARVALWDGDGQLARIYNGTDTNADQLLLGCALAAAVHLYPRQVTAACRYLNLPAAVALLVFVVVRFPDGFVHTVGYTCLGLASVAMIGHAALASGGALVQLLGWAPLVYLGRISYGLYLWHFPFALILGGRLDSIPVRAIAVLVGTLIAAAASFHLLEQPLLRWRDRVRDLRSEREASPA